MTRQEKIEWMAVWAAKNHLALELDGGVGFGRDCVGVLAGDLYPDHQWYCPSTYERLDANGAVWTPENAYHKHPCVAVLGHGEAAEAELYEWLKWFDANEFKLETGIDSVASLDPVKVLFGQHKWARMVKCKQGPT